MKKTIPFDIKYRPQIESGEMKVQTKEGYPTRIICWDRKGHEFCPICGLVYSEKQKLEDVHTFRLDGTCIGFPKKDLVLVAEEPEPELTEFEKHLVFLYYDEPCNFEEVRKDANELLELAKKEIFNDFTGWYLYWGDGKVTYEGSPCVIEKKADEK